MTTRHGGNLPTGPARSPVPVVDTQIPNAPVWSGVCLWQTPKWKMAPEKLLHYRSEPRHTGDSR